MSGKGSKISSNPNLLAEFDAARNSPHTPDTLTLQSNRKVWWVCKGNGHSWQASPGNRYRGKGCPTCSGRIAWVGVNDMATTHPDLAYEFDDNKNFPDTPSTVKAGSNKKLWWRCSAYNHSWLASPNGRKQGNGCPVCSGRQVLKGFNDMASTKPDVAQRFDLTKNLPFTPETVTASSDLKLWWVCPLQHSWQSRAANVSMGQGCPVCAGKKPLAGYNDIQTLYPDLVREFDYARNAPELPSTLTSGSSFRAWWLCAKSGHSWQSPIYNRTYGDSGCPKCRPESVPEVALRDALGGLKARLPVKGKSGNLTTKEVDIWLEASLVVVEYDGWYWHKDKIDQDTRITQNLIGEGYEVVRVRESPLGFLPQVEGLHQVKFNPKIESYDRLAEDIRYLISTIRRGN